MPVALKLVTPPSGEPLTVAEVKNHLRVDGTADDTEIGSTLIPAARRATEKYLGQALFTSTWALYLDAFPGLLPGGLTPWTPPPPTAREALSVRIPEIRIPLAPVQSISSIQYYDADGTLQTLDTSRYQADLVSEPARLLPTFGQYWPVTAPRLNSVVITFVAGYGSSEANVPPDLRAAMLLQIRDLYDGNTGQDELSKAAKRLLDLNWGGVLYAAN